MSKDAKMTELKASKEALELRRKDLETELLVVEAKLETINEMFSMFEDRIATHKPIPAKRRRSSDVKKTVLDILRDSASPLPARVVLAAAESRNVRTNLTSVASTLSKLKNEGVLDINKGEYLIKNRVYESQEAA